MAVRITPSKGGKPDKLWRDALMRAVHREVEKGKPTKRLEALADKCVELALSGDMAAMQEIGNRLDGRAVQPVSADPDDPPRLIVEIVDPTRRPEAPPALAAPQGNGRLIDLAPERRDGCQREEWNR